MNEKYRKAYAIAKTIGKRKDKRKAILFLCQCWKEMLGVQK